MTMDNSSTSSTSTTSGSGSPPRPGVKRGLSRSYSAVTIMASETGMQFHHLPRVDLDKGVSLAIGGSAAALLAGGIVSPIVTVVDLAIVRAQFERTRLFPALRQTVQSLWAGSLAWNPALKLMGGVYIGTYAVANATELTCKYNGVSWEAPTAVATSIYNVSAIAWKDREFARLSSKTPAVFPLKSYALMAGRDGLTILSSFVLKNRVQQRLEADYGMRHRDADLAASFAVPIAAQFLSTPLHILAFDIYGRPRASVWSRAAAVASGYASVCTGRVMRCLPAFGLGSFANSELKEHFFEMHGMPTKRRD